MEKQMKLNKTACPVAAEMSGKDRPQKEPYAAPAIEVVDVKVEQGFATSSPQWGDPQPW